MTASCSTNDNLILGFGNGALAVIDTIGKMTDENCLSNLVLNFTDDSDKPVEKLRVVILDNEPVLMALVDA